MTRSPIRLGLVAALTAGLLGAVATGGEAAPTATWQLMNDNQTACYSPRVTSSYYGIWIKGSWTHAIRVGISRLPAGGSFTTSYAPIPPGSSTGVYSLAYVDATIPATTPVGTYTASLWANDGTTRESVPVTLVVKARCGY
jgi:hypothetical protein